MARRTELRGPQRRQARADTTGIATRLRCRRYCGRARPGRHPIPEWSPRRPGLSPNRSSHRTPLAVDLAAAALRSRISPPCALWASSLLPGRRVLTNGASGGGTVRRATGHPRRSICDRLGGMAGTRRRPEGARRRRGRGRARRYRYAGRCGTRQCRRPSGRSSAWQLLAPGGTLQSIGRTSGETAGFPPYSTIGPAKLLVPCLDVVSAGADPAELVRFVESGASGGDRPVGSAGAIRHRRGAAQPTNQWRGRFRCDGSTAQR